MQRVVDQRKPAAEIDTPQEAFDQTEKERAGTDSLEGGEQNFQHLAHVERAPWCQ